MPHLWTRDDPAVVMESDHRVQHLLTAVLEADREISRLPQDDTYSLYEAAYRWAAQIAPTDAFYICLYNPADRTISFDYIRDGALYDAPMTRPLGHGPTSWVLRNARPFLYREGDALQRAGVPFGCTDHLSCSALHVPICIPEREVPLGVLSTQSYAPIAYSPACVSVLQWLADRIGAVLHRIHRDGACERCRISQSARLAEHEENVMALRRTFIDSLSQVGRELFPLTQIECRHSDVLRDAIDHVQQVCHRAQSTMNHPPTHAALKPVSFPGDAGSQGLTDREREIMLMLAQGLSNAEIAKRLFVSVNTVKFHCKNIYEKLGVSNRAQAVYCITRLAPAGK